MAKLNNVSKFVLNHREGSRKARIHAKWTEKGDIAARKYALTLKDDNGEAPKATTINSWFSQFRKEARAVEKAAKRKPRVAKVKEEAIAA